MTVEVQAGAVRPRRILIAEDVDINRDILASVLEEEGHDLVFAQDGAQALALVPGGAFDLILMDVQMPVMDGVEATLRIRALQGPERTVPIFALSANLTADERERYLAAGMDDCLVKPYDWDQLAAAIDRAGGADGYVTKPFEADSLMRAVRTVVGLPAKDGAAPDSAADPWVNRDASFWKT